MKLRLSCVLVWGVVAVPTLADVFNMPSGLTSLELVTVGNPGNAPDSEVMEDGTTGYGAVRYSYSIGKFEVTAAQYCEFLNAVAATDTFGLYRPNMWTTSSGCQIVQHGSPGSYTYSVDSNWANRPANLMTWGSAARFCNWLTNGQPTGPQDATTTEDGSYALNGRNDYSLLMTITRNANARFVIPTEDEWYKAAYYDPSTCTYYDYPTGTNATPSNDLLDPDPGNNANFYQSGSTLSYPFYASEVAAFENSSSPYNTFDQGGNVREWTEGFKSYGRCVRGGCFYDGEMHLRSMSRDFDGPANCSESAGFRIVEIPEPASIGSLAGGTILVVWRRTGRLFRFSRT
jgi:sulfatase modifying factor 1